MSSRQAQILAQRREQLVARSDAQRAMLAERFAALRAQLSVEALLARGARAAFAGGRGGRSLGMRLVAAVLLGFKVWRLFQARSSR